jgi:Domain of unknown function (DUF4387)
MPKLRNLVESIKSANAGASWMTFDLVLPDDELLESIWAGGVLSPELVGRLYHLDRKAVRIFRCDPVRTIKITIPRQSGLGGPDETDFDGVQQFVPLLDVDVDVQLGSSS